MRRCLAVVTLAAAPPARVLLRERTNRRLREQVKPPVGHVVMAIPLAVEGGSMFAGQPLERESLIEIDDADMGEIPTHPVVPRMSGTPGAIRRRAPHLGEQTVAILSEVGYSETEIADMVAAGAARLPAAR